MQDWDCANRLFLLGSNFRIFLSLKQTNQKFTWLQTFPSALNEAHWMLLKAKKCWIHKRGGNIISCFLRSSVVDTIME